MRARNTRMVNRQESPNRRRWRLHRERASAQTRRPFCAPVGRCGNEIGDQVRAFAQSPRRRHARRRQFSAKSKSGEAVRQWIRKRIPPSKCPFPRCRRPRRRLSRNRRAAQAWKITDSGLVHGGSGSRDAGPALFKQRFRRPLYKSGFAAGPAGVCVSHERLDAHGGTSPRTRASEDKNCVETV